MSVGTTHIGRSTGVFDRWFGLGNNGLATTADLWNNDRLDDCYWSDGEIVARPGFCTDVYFDEAMRFMDAARADETPFFTYIATNVPHWDWNVRPEWLKPYAGVKPRERACFYASIERADWNLGRLLDYLHQTGLAERTLLVFLTDNGSDVPGKQTSYTAGMRGHKGSLYEGGHRVPCFFRGPRAVVGKARDVDAFTAHVDLLPTFVDLCGLSAPTQKHLPWDGRSLRPLLRGDGAWPDRLLIMHVQNHLDQPAKGIRAVVMTSQWRLVNGKELYDITKDRSQQHEVAAKHPDVVRRLREAYDRHWTELAFDEHLLERPQIGPGTPTLRLTPDLTQNGNFIWQQDVRQGKSLRPPVWLLDVTQSGEYRFELRRWPREVDQAMTVGLPAHHDEDLVYCGHAGSTTAVPGTALPIASVELRFSTGQVLRSRVAPSATSVSFSVELLAGPLDIEAWLLDAQGERLTGAYYVYAESAPTH